MKVSPNSPLAWSAFSFNGRIKHGERREKFTPSHATALVIIIIYIQNECIEKFQFQLCSKYDREHDIDIILR